MVLPPARHLAAPPRQGTRRCIGRRPGLTIAADAAASVPSQYSLALRILVPLLILPALRCGDVRVQGREPAPWSLVPLTLDHGPCSMIGREVLSRRLGLVRVSANIHELVNQNLLGS